MGSFEFSVQPLLYYAGTIFQALIPVALVGAGIGLGIGLLRLVGRAISSAVGGG